MLKSGTVVTVQDLHSTMQRLKPPPVKPKTKAAPIFTFHYAKIKTEYEGKYDKFKTLFTFHYAKIKT